MTILFISDLHLHESRPEVTQAFYRFLKEQAQGTEALYILGDFFDAWIGDDDDSALGSAVAQQLNELSASGTNIYLMHGNRDFLIGNEFAASAGAELIHDPSIIDLYGRPTLLMHGDSLCTEDKEYLVFRQQVRSSAWQQQVLSRSLAERRALAAQIRATSQSMNSLKAEDIMDVTPAEIIRVMKETEVNYLIHGHTHRPARHSFDIDGVRCERIVLGDWHHSGWCLSVTADDINLHSWQIP